MCLEMHTVHHIKYIHRKSMISYFLLRIRVYHYEMCRTILDAMLWL